MSAPLVIQAIVQPDGRVEVKLPELHPGDVVTVTITPAVNGTSRNLSLMDVLSRAPGHRAFKTAEEVDAYLREERASWDD